jgi:hypothetical protein
MDISDIINDIAGFCLIGLTVWLPLAIRRDKKRKEKRNGK